MKQRTKEAVDFIQSNLRGMGDVFVGFSGGKDSIVIARLMVLAGVDHSLVYTSTGIDPPELVRFIKTHYPHCETVYPKKSFFSLIVTKNPPANFSRWCCDHLKKLPTEKDPRKSRVLGIRAEESRKRKEYPRVNHFQKTGITQYYPILHWTEGDVWDFIDDQRLSYPSLYDDGFSRIGCVVCPYHSNKSLSIHAMYKERWPKYFSLFERSVRQWFDKRTAQGKPMFHESPEEFTKEWYKGNVNWYKRSRHENNA